MTRVLLIATCFFAGLITFSNPSAFASPRQETTVEISDSKQRTWTSADGKFRQPGTLVEVQGDKVRLATPSGKFMSVPLNKLSKEDKKFVEAERARSAASSPFQAEGDAEGDSPFMDEGSGADSTEGNSSGETEVLEVNFNSAKAIALQSKTPIDLNSNRWKALDLGDKVDSIQIPCESVHWSINQCFASPDQKFLIVTFHDPFGKDAGEMERPRGNAARSSQGRQAAHAGSTKNWLEIYALPSGEQTGKYYLRDEAEVGDFDPQRKCFLASSGKFSPDASIQIYKLAQNQLALTKVCYGVRGFGNSAINSARFLADGKIVVGLNDKLVVLNADSLKPLFSCANSNQDWRMSNDRRFALIENQGRKFEVDLIEGKCVAAESSQKVATGMGVVSPDEKWTAELENRMVTIRDRKGKVEDQFYVPVYWPQAGLTWLDDRTLRAQTPQQHNHFIDIKNRVALLEVIEIGGAAVANRGWNVSKAPGSGGEWFFTVSPVQSLANQDNGLPSLDECRKRIGSKGDELLLLQEGDEVSLKVDLQADPSIAGEVEEIVKGLLESRGVTIEDSAEDELRLESTAQEDTIEYRRFGSPPWDARSVETVKVRAVTSTLSLVRDGKVVWSIGSSSGAPGIIMHLKEGETAQQAVDRQNVGPAEFWRNLKLPRHIAVHPNGNAWVRFRKTPEGFQPME